MGQARAHARKWRWRGRPGWRMPGRILAPEHTLWAYAAPAEGEALARLWPAGEHAARLLGTGVGKVAATHAIGRALCRGDVALVISIGVCGAHRGGSLGIGSVCVVEKDTLADEGVAHPGGFLDLAALGLAATPPLLADPARVRAAASVLGAPIVAGATVSTCSGTDALAAERTLRHPGAVIETMEGAAVAYVCAALGVPWIGIRTVSNFTGDRDRAQWDLPAALVALGRAEAALRAAGW